MMMSNTLILSPAKKKKKNKIYHNNIINTTKHFRIYVIIMCRNVTQLIPRVNTLPNKIMCENTNHQYWGASPIVVYTHVKLYTCVLSIRDCYHRKNTLKKLTLTTLK